MRERAAELGGSVLGRSSATGTWRSRAAVRLPSHGLRAVAAATAPDLPLPDPA